MQHYSREKKGLKILNLLFYLLMIGANALANTNIFGQATTEEISAKYSNLFTPAGITFAIWGVIYIMLGYFVLYQLGKNGYGARKEATEKIGLWFIVPCILNGLWLFFWAFDMIGLSMIAMIALLIVLYLIYFRVYTVEAYLYNDEKKGFLLPFSLYTGWISVATIANFAAFVKYMNWNLFNLPEALWVSIGIAVAVLVNLFFITMRKDKAFGFVGIWALAGIVYARYLDGNLMPVGYVAGVAIFVLLAVIINSHGRKSHSN